jgi:hypothetical protein
MIALDVAGVQLWTGWSWGWLHAMPAVVLYTFIRHLATPRAGQRWADLVRERDEAVHERAEAWAELDQLRAEAAQRPALVDQAESDAALTVAGRTYSLNQLARAFDVSKTTAGRRLAAVDQEGN